MSKAFVCPGAAAISGTPTLKIKRCPDCGGEIEVFSTDKDIVCQKCGRTIYNNIISCAKWCSHAEECLGEDKFRELFDQNNKEDE